MLSGLSRAFAWLVALLYGATGLILYLAHVWAAPRFAWNASPLVTMTVGGWCLGNAWAAALAARDWRFSRSGAVLLYLSLFGAFQIAVVLTFQSRLRLGHALAWLYLAALLCNGIAALVWLMDWVHRRPAYAVDGPSYGGISRAFGIFFLLFVGFLGTYGLIAPPNGRGLNASIFPEILSPFSLRAFGAFYLALSLSTLPLLFVPRLDSGVFFAVAGQGLLLSITAATLYFNSTFDFATRPTQALYLGAYLVVGAFTWANINRFGASRRRSASSEQLPG
jgi:hypothetical protein